MSVPAHGLLSGETPGWDGRAHVDPRSRIAAGPQALRGGGVPQRMWQNEFCDVDSAKTFRRLESDHEWRRHSVDANPQRASLCRESGEWLLWRRARNQLQIEPERDEGDFARHALY